MVGRQVAKAGSLLPLLETVTPLRRPAEQSRTETPTQAAGWKGEGSPDSLCVLRKKGEACVGALLDWKSGNLYQQEAQVEQFWGFLNSFIEA